MYNPTYTHMDSERNMSREMALILWSISSRTILLQHCCYAKPYRKSAQLWMQLYAIQYIKSFTMLVVLVSLKIAHGMASLIRKIYRAGKINDLFICFQFMCVCKIGGQQRFFLKYVLVWHNIFGKIFLSSEERDTAMENQKRFCNIIRLAAMVLQ